MSVIHHFRDNLISRYGKALHRIPIDLRLSCPHRVNGRGGCTFCGEDGARAVHLQDDLDLEEQVRKGIAFASERYGATPPYIAYFQSYTNTYGELEKIRERYEHTLRLADFAVVIVATRPDCLGDDVLEYLAELNARYELWVELGIQSASDRTLETINRGHDWACSVNAIQRLNARGIKVTAHLILGLPDETIDDIRHTAEALAALPVDGVKFHQMMILKHTPLAKLRHNEPHRFHITNEYDYAAALATALRILPENICVMRLCADATTENLIAPKWWMKKGQFLTFFERYYNSASNDPAAILVPTDDGSFTAFHPQYRQHFHSSAGAAGEAQTRFMLPADLATHLKQQDIKLLDIGFGLGYNAFAAFDCAMQTAKHKIEIHTLESDERVFPLALAAQDAERQRIIRTLINGDTVQTEHASIALHLNDARTYIKNMDTMFDLVFLDAFSPDVNVELWTYDIFRKLYRHMAPNGMLLTYSSAFPVIGGLHRAGFTLGAGPVFGKKRGGLVAVKGELPSHIPPLRPKDLKIAAASTAGVAYRDPYFNAAHEEIRCRRENTVARLRKLGIPKWLK